MYQLRHLLVLAVGLTLASSASAQTNFTFGGFAKLDVLNSRYNDGDVASESPLRDFHFPAAIPVGGSGEYVDIDFHVKESRFNFATQTKLGEEDLKSFLEFDFMLSPGGDERISNSFNPRLRHFYFTYGNWLFGQTWMTFQIVILPEDLDFIGVTDGTIFGRQPMIRYTNGPWQFSIENPETVVTAHQTGDRVVTESGRIPDIFARYNAAGDWGTFSVAAIGRALSTDNPGRTFDHVKPGFGLTAGGQLDIGKRDNLYAVAFGGAGLGRYAALNFANSAAIDANDGLEVINSAGGWFGFRHWWNDAWRTSANISGIFVDNEVTCSGTGVNKSAQSFSGNLLYSPHEQLTFGVEGMAARRELEDGRDGTFLRLQFSAKYAFNYATSN
ncbi:DcaP family trimeric outer membrane transporter [Bacteroidota bacterium]